MKTPLIHLVTRHEDVIEEVFRVAQVHPLVVEPVVAGVAVEQEIFDRVIGVLNKLAGTSYTQDDFCDVHILECKREGRYT